ncbi:nitroreductase family protein [Saccharothrix obliqua]|uniref:nitroreductase family protein n=1 Tax=Saccharothrix obliqua TaxID=2861747 RepID=UPI001C5CF349|nr:nitroreductase family protein [Saccharothrix obliqua]MBW4719726.1 nitroreductase family protein [Saccharothrix obliqua]
MELHPLIANRRSPRAFDPDAALAPDVLEALFEAARWAASHGNTQPARFVVGLRGDDTFQRVFDVLRPGNQTWAVRASALVLAARATTDDRGPIPNTEFGLGLAVQNLVLQAEHLGLITHQMGGFDHDAAARAFGLPADVVPVVVVAVGVPGDVGLLPPDLQAREHAPRVRKPLSETVFTGAWGNPLLPES